MFSPSPRHKGSQRDKVLRGEDSHREPLVAEPSSPAGGEAAGARSAGQVGRWAVMDAAAPSSHRNAKWRQLTVSYRSVTGTQIYWACGQACERERERETERQRDRQTDRQTGVLLTSLIRCYQVASSRRVLAFSILSPRQISLGLFLVLHLQDPWQGKQ